MIYNHHRDGVDNEFYLNEIRRAKGKVLEVGVGTGRFFIDALNSGADISGIDISPCMLDILKMKLDANQQYRVSLQNMMDFKFDNSFDLIIAPFRVFMHLLDVDDQLKALANVHKHLNSGGKFIFDTFVPNLQQLINGIHDHVDFNGEYKPGEMLKRTVSNKAELMQQIINIHFHLDWIENGKKLSEDWHTALRYFFRFELEHLIERSAFENYRILGDFLGNELREDSKEFIIICIKE